MLLIIVWLKKKKKELKIFLILHNGENLGGKYTNFFF